MSSSTVVDMFDDIDPHQQDAAFYCDGGGSSAVGVVYNAEQDRSIHIYCDGVMKVMDNRDGSIYRSALELIQNGYRTDQGLSDGEDRGEISFENNPWFSLYEDDEEVGITHTINDAIDIAKNLLDKVASV